MRDQFSHSYIFSMASHRAPREVTGKSSHKNSIVTVQPCLAKSTVCRNVRTDPQSAGLTALAFAETAKEAHRRLLVASPLHQDINRVAVLVDRSPQIRLFALDAHTPFIKMPRITKSTLSLLHCPCVCRSKLPAPLANGVVGDGDASFASHSSTSRKLRQKR